MYPTRRASPLLLEHFIGKNMFSGCGLTDSGGSALAALPIYCDFTLRAKNRNIFCPNRIEVKVLRKLRKCAPGVSKGAALIAGAINSAPLGRLLFVLFLPKQEKNITAVTERYRFLQSSCLSLWERCPKGAERAFPLSVTPVGVPALPKGEPSTDYKNP